ncbi:MAG: PQQ-like beta-propeller repeat protein [Candidatus Hydrogenedentes bacterium]|nr:PQQ-like beta-propeller repeat protein [Candidatus Hydrogenedentota bacterium]
MRFQRIWCLVAIVVPALTGYGAAPEDNWPSWRGPNNNGVAAKSNPPSTWSETQNIKWKTALPGHGTSTPIIWGDKIFFQTAVPTQEEPAPPAAPPQDKSQVSGPQSGGTNPYGPQASAPQPEGQRDGGRREGGRSGRGGMRTPPPTFPYKFNVVCIDRKSGKLLWEKTAREEVPHEGRHPTGSYASSSPVTDGKLMWVSFGSRGLYCYDLDGTQKWNRDLGKMQMKNSFGEGSSPALAGDAIVVLMDHEAGSKIMAFNKDTGEPLWEKAREEATAWSSPHPVEVNGALQIVTAATNRIRSYNAKTGDIVWECAGLTANTIPTPVSGFGRVFCTSGFRGYSLKAIDLAHTGDLTGTPAIAWEVAQGTPYVASPLLYDDRIYLTADRGAVLSCYDAKSGKQLYSGQEIEGLAQIYASPAGAGDKIYIADREGKVAVVKKSDSFELLATNALDDGFDASPVFAGKELYLKGRKNLYCIAEN